MVPFGLKLCSKIIQPTPVPGPWQGDCCSSKCWELGLELALKPPFLALHPQWLGLIRGVLLSTAEQGCPSSQMVAPCAHQIGA